MIEEKNITNTENGGDNFSSYFQPLVVDRNVREGEEILTQVISIDENHVVLNAGLKSEARVPIEEFVTDAGVMEVEVGDTVEVEVEMLENGRGEVVLSRHNTRRKKAWLKIKDAIKNDGVIEGVIQGRVRSGYSVLCDGVRGFLPGSLVDVVPQSSDDQNSLVGQRMEFKPIKINSSRNSVVVSRRAVIERNILNIDVNDTAEFSEGTVLTGTVQRVVDYGAFVEIGTGIYGLLHITDISWKHINNVADVLKVGDKIEVKIIRLDLEKKRVALSMKQLKPDPWEYFDRSHPVGSRLFGKVVRIEDYGAFIEIADGVQGLVHSSEISWKRKHMNAEEIWSIGEEVEVMVLEMDKKRRRVSLGSKQCYPNPWQEFAAAYRKGDRINGVIKSISDIGLFVELPGGIHGLVHISEISYEENGDKAIKAYEKEQTIEMLVLSIDVSKERVSLGIKQLTDGEFEEFIEKHLKGTKITGKISSIIAKGAHVELTENIRAYLPIHEISESRVENVSEYVKEGEELSFILVDIDRKNRRAILSLKERDRALREQSLLESANFQPNTKLGDLLQAKLEETNNEKDDKDSKDKHE